MNDPSKDINSVVLITFGKQITIHCRDGTIIDTLAIISKEQLQIGQFDGIAEEVTLLTIGSDIQLGRGNQVTIDGSQWDVDRKIKDDGMLAKWNIHAA